MPSKYWENSADLSRDSSAESSQDSQEPSEDVEEMGRLQEESRSNGKGNANQNLEWDLGGDEDEAFNLELDGNGDQDSKWESESNEAQHSRWGTDENEEQDLLWNSNEKEKEGPVAQNGNVGTVSRAMATNSRLPILQPHERASLFYLSLIEGRCRTQAAASINAGRPLEDHVAENHPEVEVLASHLFGEMSQELLKAGMIPEEFVGRPLPELRSYLLTFDSMINNIATTPQDLPDFDLYRTLDSNYNLPRGSIATITSSEDSLDVFTGDRSSQILRSVSAFETRPSQPSRTGSAIEARSSNTPGLGSAFRTGQSLRTGSATDNRPSSPRSVSATEIRPFRPLRSGSAIESRPSELPRNRSATDTRSSQLLGTGSASESRPFKPLRAGSALEHQSSQTIRTAPALDQRFPQSLLTGSPLDHQSSQTLLPKSAIKLDSSSLDDLSQRALTTTRYNSSHRPFFTTPFVPSRALVRGSVPASPFDQPSYESAASANYIDFGRSLSSSLEETEYNSRALVLRNRFNMSQSSRPAMAGPIPRIISLLSTGQDLSELSTPVSIFESEYHNKKLLGTGGFGSVYKAVYFLDKAEYAIKKIVIPASTVDKMLKKGKMEGLLNEVRAMAMLNHPHIVRYHHSWLESRPAGTGSEGSDEDEDDEDDEEDDDDNLPSVASKLQSISIGNEKALARHFSKEKSNRRSLSQSIQFENPSPVSSPAPSPKKLVSKFFASPSPSSSSSDEEEDSSPLPSQIDVLIYIKMTSYPLSLADYLEKEQHCFHPLPTIHLLQRLLAGVTYLHRKQIIHQDLKPANIFLAFPEDEERSLPSDAFVDTTCQHCDSSVSTKVVTKPKLLSPCIGDFGLVKDLREAGVMGEEGSTFYRPRRKEVVCEKLDVYALGVVALELCVRFGSAMERVVVLKGVKEGILPTGWEEGGCEVLGEGIRGMLCESREDRWGCERVGTWLDEVERAVKGELDEGMGKGKGKGKEILR